MAQEPEQPAGPRRPAARAVAKPAAGGTAKPVSAKPVAAKPAAEKSGAEKSAGAAPSASARRSALLARRAAKAAATSAKPAAKPTVAKPAAAAEPTTIRIRPMAQPARWRFRHKGLLAGFVLLVVLPVLLATAYLNLRAADQYASTLGFTVRSEELPSASDLLGGIGSALGGGGSKDSDILYDFIRSQELVAAVDTELDLRRIWARHSGRDPVFGFTPDGSIEDLVSYWRRMVRISYDSGSGLMELRVLAFTRDEAQGIARAIHAASTAMINDLSAAARGDAMRYAEADLALALGRLQAARGALTAYRLQHNIVDVSADIQGQMGLLNTLQAQLAEALIEHDLLRGSARPEDPRLGQITARIEVIRVRINEERAKLGAGGAEGGYANTVAEFERLNVERQFAETTYLAALQALDAARAEANRQTRYLATYIRPTIAERSEFPQHLLIVGLVFFFAFLIWAIGCLIFYALRDRR